MTSCYVCRQELLAARRVCTQDGRYWIALSRGTKRNKEEHLHECSSGSTGVVEEQRGTSSLRDVPLVPPHETPDFQTAAPVCASSRTGAEPEQPALSPIAKTILATVTKEGVAPDDVERTANHAHPKAGALIKATINELLLSGKIGRVNGKLVASGETRP